MPLIPITAIVMTLNEEQNLDQCLASLARFDDVVVVDSGSSDNTLDIAAKRGARTVNFVWDGAYPKKKQWALENIEPRHRYVLFVDADERVPSELAAEMADLIQSTPAPAAAAVRYNYHFLGRRLRFGHKPEKVILLDRFRCHFPVVDDLHVSNMWEVEGHYQPVVQGPIHTLSTPMEHNDAQDLYHYFARHNRYSDWEAKVNVQDFELEAASTKTRKMAKTILHLAPFPAALAFAHSYVLRLGFLDGRAGFHFALFRAYYYWQISLKRSQYARMTDA